MAGNCAQGVASNVMLKAGGGTLLLKKRDFYIVFSMSIGLYASCANAQSTDLDVVQEYDKSVKSARQITPLGDTPFGEQISMYSGATEFAVTDISLAGNSDLPVSLGRRFVVEDRADPNRQDFNLSGFGDWDIEIPYLEGTFTKNLGWQVEGSSPYSRCSAVQPPLGSPYFSSWEVWQGTTLHIPGAENAKILKRDEGYSVPSDGQIYPWITNNKTVLRCLTATKNGYDGEAFLAVTSAGVKYYFDWGIERAAESLRKGFSTRTDRKRVLLLASRVEDRFGNWVDYSYTGDRLTSISSNDGRTISLSYNGNRIVQASVNGRSWSFAYGENGYDLSTVTSPTGQKWMYAKLGKLQAPFVQQPSEDAGPCDPATVQYFAPFIYTITHPSGLVGQFRFEQYRIYRYPDPGVCSYGSPKYFDVRGLTSRTISGPGIPSQTTNYSVTQLPSTSGTWSTITHSDGSKDRFLYGRVAQASNTPPFMDDGLLLQEQNLSSSGAIARERAMSYQLDPNATTSYLKNIGTPLRFLEPDAGLVRPVISGSVSQDGASFNTMTESFDSLARPLSVTKSSSLGYSRTEATAYSDNLSKWVLGQVKSVTCTAPASCANQVMSQADYDATTALPLKTYAFGKLKQTLTYNTDGTVATVKDGNNNVTTLSSWKRGIPQSIKHPITPESPTGATESAVVDDNGWIDSVTDENSFVTKYDYDTMGRLTLVDYPDGDSVNWNNTTQSFAPYPATHYGLPAGSWIQITDTGKSRKIVHFDALWRPVVEEAFDNTNSTTLAATHSIVVKRYDTQGRLVFQSYPVSSLSSYTDTLKGTTTSYDALDRPTTVKQDSELGVLTTTTEYLPGFQTRVTNPRGQKTTTSYMAWDQPTTELPVAIDQPKGVRTTIPRDAYGKPLQVTRSGPDQ